MKTKLNRLGILVLVGLCLLKPALAQTQTHGVRDKDTTASTCKNEPTAVDIRICEERKAYDERYTLIPHKQSYVLVFSHTDKISEASWAGLDGDPQNEEVKLQISFKLPLYRNIIKKKLSAYFGYTQVSFWQMYNWDASAPFRETNYEPEIMLYYFSGFEFLGMRNPLITLGFNHQSNGRSGSLSRSWNRLYLDFILARQNFAVSIKPWYRIPEGEEGDNNPDINKYLGYGELTAAYYSAIGGVYSLLFRNNLEMKNKNRGAVQFDVSYPVNKKPQVYFQYFYGYGENLVDYNHLTQRGGIGVLMSNWL